MALIAECAFRQRKAASVMGYHCWAIHHSQSLRRSLFVLPPSAADQKEAKDANQNGSCTKAGT